MENVNIRNNIIKALGEVFIYLEEDETDNVDLELFIESSIQFISFLIALENMFGIEIPSELLLFDNFKYLDNICIIIEELLSE